VHFVGIGGAGMGALAELLLALGYVVSGSDLKDSRVVGRLRDLGATVTVGPHRAASVDAAEHVVVSNAVPEGNPEVRSAIEHGIEVLPRSVLLGRIFEAGRGIAVSGTHGKTTTASMLARVLAGAGLEPSFVIGGDLNDVGSGAALGASDLVVVEADEAYGSFLDLHPDLAVVTNVDTDHLDHYPDQAAIDTAFLAFLAQRRSDGPAVVCIDDPGVRRILDGIDPPVVTYGTTGDDMVVEVTEEGRALRWHGTRLGVLRLPVPGTHNALNAAGAGAAALLLGADPDAVLAALAAFSGVERRFSVRGSEAGVVVIDDYAHNPRKVAATLRAAREVYPEGRVVVLFQPHLYSRTKRLADAFGEAFEDADVVVVTDVYGAREEPEPGVNGRLISDAIRERTTTGTVPAYVPRLEEAAGFVAGLVGPGDVVLTLGAGDVTTAAPRILDLLRGTGSSSAVR
jgi:UDP-N-acetylmuramate--alanine ligase